MRLHKIRHAALWLDHITQAHSNDTKIRTRLIAEVDDDVKFMQDKMVIEKANRQEIKKRLFVQRKNFDHLY